MTIGQVKALSTRFNIDPALFLLNTVLFLYLDSRCLPNIASNFLRFL